MAEKSSGFAPKVRGVEGSSKERASSKEVVGGRYRGLDLSQLHGGRPVAFGVDAKSRYVDDPVDHADDAQIPSSKPRTPRKVNADVAESRSRDPVEGQVVYTDHNQTAFI